MLKSVKQMLTDIKNHMAVPNPNVGEVVRLSTNIIMQLDDLREQAIESGDFETLREIKAIERELRSIELPNTHWKREKSPDEPEL